MFFYCFVVDFLLLLLLLFPSSPAPFPPPPSPSNLPIVLIGFFSVKYRQYKIFLFIATRIRDCFNDLIDAVAARSRHGRRGSASRSRQ